MLALAVLLQGRRLEVDVSAMCTSCHCLNCLPQLLSIQPWCISCSETAFILVYLSVLSHTASPTYSLPLPSGLEFALAMLLHRRGHLTG